MKTLITRLLVTLCLTVLASCGPRMDVAEWTEELLLHDGTSITVWRKAVAKSGGFPEPRGANIEFELKYEPMGVHWKGSPLRPLFSFDIIEGTPWLMTSILDAETCRSMKKTDFRAQFYKWQGGQWLQVPVDEFPIHQARSNMWESYWGRKPDDDAKGHITWQKKRGGHLNTPPESVYQLLTSHNQFCSNFQ
jgi:hypothetical protein